MVNLVDDLCVEFNSFIGRASAVIANNLPKNQVRNTSFFGALLKEAENFFEKKADKAIIAYNIKAAIYNFATCVAIVGIAQLIFGNPFALITLGASIAGRLFVDRAMQKTFVGSAANEQQATDDRILSLFFKPFHRK